MHSGVLKTQADKLHPDELKRLRDDWRQRYGGSDNTGKVAILTKGLDFQQTQMTPKDMEFIEGKKMNRDEILANYGVGPEILGRTESQTRANAETAVFVFMRFGVLHFVENILDTLNNDLLPAFPGTDNMEFCVDDLVPENMEEKRLNSAVLMDSGALTPDEMRQQFGLEPLGIAGVRVVSVSNAF